MEKSSGPRTESEIVSAYHSGGLAREIFNPSNLKDADFLNTCIDLHNGGKIDLLSLVEHPDFEEVAGHDFFCGQNFYCEAIPRLDAPLVSMMRCVDSLAKKGGEDLAAGLPNAAFREWCKASLVRAREVISGAKEGDLLAQEFLTFALMAGDLAEEAMEFVESYTDKRRVFGVTALGRITYSNDKIACDALQALRRSLDNEPDDQLFANVLLSALGIAKSTNQTTNDQVFSIVQRICETPRPEACHSCARALWLHAKNIHEDLVALLLRPLNSLDSSHKGTIDELDHGLRELLGTSNASLGIEFVAALLSRPDNTLALSQFDGFCRGLVQGPTERFHTVFISWMLSGKRALCEGLSSVLRKAGQKEKPLELAIQDFNLSPDLQIFLCKKVIGYFFLQPVIASSVLVSVLRSCSNDVASAVRRLLFDPLLLNYGGTVGDYLRSLDKADTASAHVQAVLDRGDQYLDDLKSVGEIKELHPSEHRRQVERLRFADQMRQAHKDAEKQSVLLSLVKRSVILYGKRSITYVGGPDDRRTPMEMALKGLSFSFELPRREILDPISLDFMLRVFRAEEQIP